jgi:hypothetical protein
MFTEWLVVEAHYLRMFLKISRIPHFITLQKFMDRIAGTILQRMNTCFIVLPFVNVNKIFFGIDSSSMFILNLANMQNIVVLKDFHIVRAVLSQSRLIKDQSP